MSNPPTLQSNTSRARDIPTLTEQVPAANALPAKPEIVSISEMTSSDLELTSGAESPAVDSASAHALNTRQILSRAFALLLAIGITIVIFLFIDLDRIKRFQEYGYFGIFLTSLIGNATIALPIPSLFFTFVGGGTFNWVIVGLVSGIGEALGETTGYLAGYGGAAIIENQKIYERMKYWMEQHGILTIFVLSVVPNPLIDLAGIAAGASRYGYHKFLFAAWVGKTIKTLIFAWAGAYSVTWLLDLFGGWVG